MTDEQKTKQELIQELDRLRQRVADLEQSALAHKQGEEELRESKKILEDIAEGISDGILFLSKDFRVLWANKTALKQTGYSIEEMKGSYCYTITHHREKPCQPPNDTCPVEEAMKTGNAMTVSHTHVNKAGDKFFTEVSAYPIRNEKGEIVRFVHFSRDITERKRTEEKLRESEEHYQSLFDGVPIGLYRTSPDGRILDANLALVHMLGYPDRKSLEAINAADTYANAEDRQSWQALIKQEGVLSNFEKQLCCYGGSKIWVEENTRAVYGPEGQVLSYEGSFQDITKRKRAEEALKQSEEKYRTILENIEEGYYEVDIAGNFTFFNDSTYRIFGYPKEELIGINDRQYTDQENAKRLFQAYNKVYRTGMPDKGYDYEIIRKDGTKRYIEVSIALQKDSSGKTIGFKGIVRDITERKWAEEEREKLIRDLRETLSKVKTLSGMLPICSSCKKIRDDKGYWKQIEVYIRDHSETEFTHSICPECFKKLYPDFDDEEQ